MPDSYVVLVDQPEDWPETVWIEADTEDQARDRAAEFCCDVETAVEEGPCVVAADGCGPWAGGRSRPEAVGSEEPVRVHA